MDNVRWPVVKNKEVLGTGDENMESCTTRGRGGGDGREMTRNLKIGRGDFFLSCEEEDR